MLHHWKDLILSYKLKKESWKKMLWIGSYGRFTEILLWNRISSCSNNRALLFQNFLTSCLLDVKCLLTVCDCCRSWAIQSWFNLPVMIFIFLLGCSLCGRCRSSSFFTSCRVFRIFQLFTAIVIIFFWAFACEGVAGLRSLFFFHFMSISVLKLSLFQLSSGIILID